MPPPATGLTRARLLISTIAVWITAAVLVLTLRAVYGERPAYVHVRWAAGVEATDREALERRYNLTRGELREGRTWGYYLVDVSSANIRAMVGDVAVEDTHEIDRARFRLAEGAPRGTYAGFAAAWLPGTIETLTLLIVPLAAALTVVALLDLVGVPIRNSRRAAPIMLAIAAPGFALRTGQRALLLWTAERIPSASAEGAAGFRMAFAAAVLAFMVMRPVNAAWIPDASDRDGLSPVVRGVTAAFAAWPAAADWLRAWIVGWGVLFAAGAFTRPAFAMLTAGLFAWAVLYTSRIGMHSISALMVTLVCLLWARWGDAWSIDAVWARRRGGVVRRAPREYGYAIWMPSLVLGVTFAAAAVAKIREGGLAWISNGTVKYHFLSDAAQAPTDWGLRLAGFPGVAIAMSLAAVAVEALVVAGVCAGVYRYRAAAGVASLAILAGFVLFQGIFWPAWWILLLSFLPWHRIRSAAAPATPPRLLDGALRRAPALIVLAVVVQQIIASALRVEIDPMISAYDMYSTTYASPAEYERQAGLTYWLVLSRADGSSRSCAIDRAEAERLADIDSHATFQRQAAPLVESCAGSEPAGSVAIEGRRIAVDWERWRPAGETKVPVAGPVAWP